MMVENGGSGQAVATAAPSVSVRFELQQTVAANVSDVPRPVTVRQFSTKIAARGLTGQPLDLAPGRYLVAVELADGATAMQEAHIASDTHAVTLDIGSGTDTGVDTATPALQVPESFPKELGTRFARVPLGLESAPSGDEAGGTGETQALEDATAAFARHYRDVRPLHRGLEAAYRPAAAFGFTAREASATPSGVFARLSRSFSIQPKHQGIASITVAGNDRPGRFVLFEPVDGDRGRSVAVAIPAAPGWTAELVVADPVGLRLVPILENAHANALLSYLTEQSYKHVAAYTEVAGGNGFEDLLFAKRADPIGAAIGGYGLLSLNQLKPLTDWSENLTIVAPWLADGFAIHGETRARLGDHDKAAGCFWQMTRVGLPVFSPGLTYAETRVRLYCRHKLPTREASQEMQAWLDAVSAHVLPRLRLGEVLTTIANPELREA